MTTPRLPTAVRAIASWTSRPASTRSSPRADPDAGAGRAGTDSRTSARAAALTAAMVRKVARQPRCWPMKVPAGVPRTMPRFIPRVSLATAEACLPSGAVEAAVVIATAKNVATTRPATIRAANSTA
ncbi:hypothetical protein GCM10010405_13620 [Streptomyces macrosporus]|uniref:Uncharacterized protein n=1 Tax=Streptomyces macrosporus TaxID=44032 RepID=A0ABP5WTP4_9ACTN